MADITVTITIPDALVSRVSAATGASTRAQFQDWVRQKIKQEVIGYESQQALQAEDAKIEAAIANRDTAVQAVVSTAETEVVLT